MALECVRHMIQFILKTQQWNHSIVGLDPGIRFAAVNTALFSVPSVVLLGPGGDNMRWRSVFVMNHQEV